MGYKRRTYRLTFDDPALEGLEVVMRGASVAELTQFSELSSLGEGLMKPENAESLAELYAMLSRKVVRWNLEDEDDQPIPCTAETLADEDSRVVLAIMAGWADAVAGVPAPLARRSTGGEQLVAPSMPMETLSESLLDSLTPS
jgi:hypothetical protein